MKKYLISFLIALGLHMSLFFLPQSEIADEEYMETLFDLQLMNEEEPPKVAAPKKVSPPPPPKVQKKIVEPPPPVEPLPELDEPAEEEVVVEKKIEPVIEPVVEPQPQPSPVKVAAKPANTSVGPTLVNVNSLDNASFKPFGNKKPVYPSLARKAGIEGWVKIKVLVNEKGKVIKAEVIDYSGHSAFKQSTLAVAKKWRFPAPISKAKRVQTWYTKKVGFILND